MTGGPPGAPVPDAPLTGDPVPVTVSGELDVARPDLTSGLERALAAGARRLVVDLLDVSFSDSSVLRWWFWRGAR